MNSTFDVIAYEDHEGKTAGRKALALAHKRVCERFDRFLSQKVAFADRTARLELIEEDFAAVVKTACDEVGYADSDSINQTLWNERLIHGPDGTKTASVEKEARRPKLCPYHSEVVDASLAAGDPAAGYSAMAQHAWGEKHCQSDGYEGKCRFKPEMTTQSFWDQKKEDAEKRRDERAEQQQVQDVVEDQATGDGEAPAPTESEGITETPEAEAEGGEVVEVDFGGEASEPGLTQDELLSVAASAQRFVPLAVKTADLEAAPAPAGPPAPPEGAAPGEAAGGGNSGQANIEPRGGLHNGPVALLGFLDASINGLNARRQGGEIVSTYSPFNREGWAQVSQQPVTVSVPHPEYLPAGIAIVENGYEPSRSGPELKALAQRMHAGEVPFPPGVSPEQVKIGNTKTANPGVIDPRLAPVQGQPQQPVQQPQAPLPTAQPSSLPPNNQNPITPPGVAPQALQEPQPPVPQQPGQVPPGVNPQPFVQDPRIQQLNQQPTASTNPLGLTAEYLAAVTDTGDSNEKRESVEVDGGPEPKIDKRKWTPENLQQRLETEGENSPNKTIEQDVVHDLNDPSRPNNSDKPDQIGEHLTEHQDVTKPGGVRPNNERTWTNGPANAVS